MRSLLTFTLGLALLAPAAAAAAAVEVTLAGGARQGEAAFLTESNTLLIVCVTTPCAVAEARTEESELGPSLIVDVPVSSRWMVEGLLTQQDGDLTFRAPGVAGELLDRGTFEMTTAQIGMLRHWDRGKLRPFVAAGLGSTRLETSVGAYDLPLTPGSLPRPVDEDVFAASAALGLRASLVDRLALRLEGRAYWHDLPERLGGTLRQDELSVGVTYTF